MGIYHNRFDSKKTSDSIRFTFRGKLLGKVRGWNNEPHIHPVWVTFAEAKKLLRRRKFPSHPMLAAFLEKRDIPLRVVKTIRHREVKTCREYAAARPPLGSRRKRSQDNESELFFFEKTI